MVTNRRLDLPPHWQHRVRIAVAIAILVAPPAAATDFVVTKLGDSNDGMCDSDCSLREAVIAANLAPGPDTVVLGAGTYTLSISGANEDASATGDLDLLDDLTIKGAGRDLTVIDAGGIDRVIHIPDREQDFTIRDLTLTGGDTTLSTDGDGGGLRYTRWSFPPSLRLIHVAVTSNHSKSGGGGLALYGDALIYDCVISLNTTGTPASGGGLSFLFDTLHLIRSTVADNQAHTHGAIDNYGGTVVIDSSTVSGNVASFNGGINNFTGQLSVVNSTITGNVATSGDSGAVLNWSGSSLSIAHSTIAYNTGVPGGIYNLGSIDALANTIVANNTGGDCNAILGVTGGHNLSSDASCGFTGAGDLENIDPVLGVLQDNGGPTDTHALGPGSPAIDAGTPDPPEPWDQRGFARPADGDGDDSLVCDIGAVEAAAEAPVFTDGFEIGDTSVWSATELG